MQNTILMTIVSTLFSVSFLALVGMVWTMIQKRTAECNGNTALGTLYAGFLPKPSTAIASIAAVQSRKVTRRRVSRRRSAWGFSTAMRPVPSLNAGRKLSRRRQAQAKSTRRAPR
ncbi:MAG: hypothetical protein GXP26_16625 [Planctomycetes bacterium]|nr:hypothetical protein [Planctomycetota bacterium]